MPKFITAIITLLLTIGTTSLTLANIAPNPPKKVITHGDYFPLNREIYLKADKLPKETAIEFQNLLTSSGATVSTSFFKQFFSPKIIFKQTPNIKNVEGDEKVKITVSYKKVLVEFNTPKAGLRGVELLLTILKKRNSAYTFDGVQIIDWATKIDKPTKQKHDGFDLTDPTVNKAFIIGMINKAPQGTSYFLYAANPTRWAIESQIFDETNTKWTTLIAKPHYSIAEINEMIVAGQKKGVNVILNVNLIEENETFKEVTGHSIYSIEGMRFVRAIIEEYKNRLNIKSIAIGYIPAGIDEFYLQFIERVKELNNIDIIFE